MVAAGSTEQLDRDFLTTIAEHAVWLMEKFDLDGFRVDAVKHFIHDLGYALRGRLDESVAQVGERQLQRMPDETMRHEAIVLESGQQERQIVWTRRPVAIDEKER